MKVTMKLLLLILTTFLLVQDTSAADRFTNKACHIEDESACTYSTCEAKDKGTFFCRCRVDFYAVADACYGKPKIVVTLPKQVPEGLNVMDTVFMTCQSEGYNPDEPFSKWFLDDTEMQSAKRMDFTINGFMDEHTGAWQCQVALNGVFLPLSNELLLSLKGAPPPPPRPTSFPIASDVRIGSDVKLSCPAASDTYIWITPSAVPATSSSRVLEIADFRFTDVGKYRCKVGLLGKTSLRSEPLNIDLQVTPVVHLTPLPPAGVAFVKTGARLLLACQLDSLVLGMNVSYAWFLNGIPLSETSIQSQFEIVNFDNMFGGLYECQVIYGDTSSEKSEKRWLGTPTVSIAMESSGIAFVDGDRVTVTCEVSGPSQPAYFKWTKSGMVLGTTRSGEFVVRSFSMNDAGMYTCEVDGIGGSFQSEYLQMQYDFEVFTSTPCTEDVSACDDLPLTACQADTKRNLRFFCQCFVGLYYKDRQGCLGLKPTLSADTQSTGAIAQYSTVRLYCSEPSGMATGYTWYQNDLQVTEKNESVFAIDSFVNDITADYRCMAKYFERRWTSELSEPLQLVLEGAPSKPTLILTPGEVKFGASIWLKCYTTEQDPVSFTWHHSGRTLDNVNATLLIRPVRFESAGDYHCLVTKGKKRSQRSDPFTIAPAQVKLQTTPADILLVQPFSAITLTCDIYNTVTSFGMLAYTWFRNGQNLEAKVNTSELLRQLQIPYFNEENAGVYMCKVNDGYTDVWSKKLPLYLHTKETSATCDHECIPHSTCAFVAQPNDKCICIDGYYYRDQCRALRPTLGSVEDTTSVLPGGRVVLKCPVAWADEWRWWKYGYKIPAANSAIYTIPSFSSPVDTGEYQCQAKIREVWTFRSKAKTLTVVDAPRQPTLNITVRGAVQVGGDNIELICVEPDSATSYGWFVDDRSLGYISRDTYAISLLKFDLIGYYSCLAKSFNKWSLRSESHRITVNTKPVIKVEPDLPAFPDGNSATLSCILDSLKQGVIVDQYVWLKGEDFHQLREKSRSLRISSFSKSDIGKYFCRVVFGGESETSEPLTLYLKPDAPTIFIVTPDVQATAIKEFTYLALKCGRTVVSEAHWYYNGLMLPAESEYTMIIESFSNQHTGAYACNSLVNGAWSDIGPETELVLVGAPSKPPLNKDGEAKFGNDIFLKCHTNQFGPITWYKDNQPIVKATLGNVFYLVPFTFDDAGDYTCKVTANRQQSPRSKAIVMRASKKPVVIMLNPPLLNTIEESTPIKLACRLPDLVFNNDVIYKWFANGQLFQPRDGMIAEMSTARAYTCQVVLGGKASEMSDPFVIQLKLAAPKVRIVRPVMLDLLSIPLQTQITLQCQKIGDVEPTEWKWYAEGVELVKETGRSLTIQMFSEGDVGLYQCQVKAAGTEWSDRSPGQPLELKASASARATLTGVAALGEKITTKCLPPEFSPSTDFDFFWYDDKGVEIMESQRMSIHFTALDHWQLYCKARSKETGAMTVMADLQFDVRKKVLGEFCDPSLASQCMAGTECRQWKAWFKCTCSEGAEDRGRCVTQTQGIHECAAIGSNRECSPDAKCTLNKGSNGNAILKCQCTDSSYYFLRTHKCERKMPAGETCRRNLACDSNAQCVKITEENFGPKICQQFEPVVRGDILNPLAISDGTDSVTLDCTLPEKPPSPTYNWYKDGILVAKNALASTLLIKSPVTGRYRCQIMAMVAGTAVTYAKSEEKPLKLLAAPGTPTVQATPNTFYLGEKVDIACVAPDGVVGEVEYKWYKDGSLMPDRETQKINYASLLLSDAGGYSCRIAQSSRTSLVSYPLIVSPRVKVNLLANALEIADGDKVTLTCGEDIDSEKVKYEWQLNGVTLLETERVLVIESALYTGTYTCQAHTSFGPPSKYSTEVIILPKGGPSKPVLSVGEYKYGTDVSLLCKTTETLENARFRFYLDGDFWKEILEEVLVLPSFTNAYAGSYTCDVTFNRRRSLLSEPVILTRREIILLTVTTMRPMLQVPRAVAVPRISSLTTTTVNPKEPPRTIKGINTVIRAMANVNSGSAKRLSWACLLLVLLAALLVRNH